jgi:ankyrin repeat protein
MNEQQFLDDAEDGDVEKVLSYLSNGGNVNVTDEHNRTALLKASKHGHLDIVNILL